MPKITRATKPTKRSPTKRKTRAPRTASRPKPIPVQDLRAALEQREAELAVIDSIQQGLASKLDFQGIVDLVGDKVREVFHTGEIGIRWYDDKADLIHYLYEYEHGVRLNIPPTAHPASKTWQLLKTGQPVVINENAKQRFVELGMQLIPGTDLSKSMVNVPMMASGRVIGSIIIEDYEREHAFTDGDVRLLQTVAASMGTALENARLFDETERLLKETEQRNAELAIINCVQAALAAQLNIQGIYDAVGDKIREIFHQADIGIRIYDPQTNLMHHPYVYEGGQRVTIPSYPVVGKGFAGYVIRTRETLVINENMEQAVAQYGSRILPGTQMSQSAVYVPLLVGEQVLGLISLRDMEREHAFGNSDVRLLQTIANSMSIALENARLFGETQRLLKETEQRAAELAIINSVQQGLASQLDMQAIYDLVGDKIREIFDAEVVNISTFDTSNELTRHWYLNEKGQRFYPEATPIGVISQEMLRTKQPVLINTLAEYERRGVPVVPGTESTQSGLYVPLLVGGDVKGQISLQSIARENAFGEADMRLLMTFANSMSVALENARLFDETQRLLKETEQRAAELAIINSVQAALAAQLNIQGIYDAVGDKVREIFHQADIGIRIYDAQTNLMHYPYTYESGQRIAIPAEPFENKGFAAHVLGTRETLVVNENMARAVEQYGSSLLPGTQMEKSAVYVPLVVGEQARGVIGLIDMEREHAFGDSDVRLLQTIANSMSIALENARLFDETQRLLQETEQRAQELAMINSVQRGLASQLDVQAICDLVGDKVSGIFNAQAVMISTYDAATDMTHIRYLTESGERFYPEPAHPSVIGRTLLSTRQPLLVNTAAEFEQLGTVTVPGTANPQCGIFVPLLIGGEMKGIISVQNVIREHAFKESDLGLLTTLANSMSVALENARLFAEEQQRAAEMATINRVSQALASQSELDALIQLAGDRIRETFSADVAYIALLDRATNMINFAYHYGETHDSMPFGAGLTSKIIQTGEPLLINLDVQARRLELGTTCVATQAKSYLGVPIFVGTEAAGVVSVQSVTQEGRFSENDQRLLATIAANVGVAIQRTRLFDETKRLLAETEERVTEMATVYRISQALASELALDSLIQLVGEQIRQTFNADIVYVALHDAQTNLINFRYAHGEVMDPIQFGAGLTSRIIQTGQPLLLNQDAEARYAEMGIAVIGQLARSYLGVPIFVGKQAIGVISVQSTQQEGRFDASDVRLITTIAANVGTAIQNAQLFEQTREAQRRLADIIEFMPDASLVIDREGRVTAWNHAMEEMTGVKAQEMIGKGDYEYALPFYGERRPILIDLVSEPAEDVEKKYATIRRKGEILTGETYASHLKGGGVYVAGTASALHDANGDIVGAIELIRDITERKHAEEELEKAKQAADAANQAKSVFLAMMSHEIRTPMNAIIGMSGLLMDTPLNAEQREYADTIRTSGDALLTIINDILDFSKIEAGKLELESQPFEVRACVESALDLIAPRAADKGLELACIVEDDVPAAVIGDVTRLRQICINLLTNAVKFTEHGEVVISVGVSRGEGNHKVRPNELHFSVRDTGIGVPPDRQGLLFRSFSQVDATITRRYGGTGLGLAVSKRLVEMMGGTMWMESEGIPGKGSTFHFTLAAPPAPDFAARPRVVGEQSQLKDKRLLIVDDNDTNRLIVIRLARNWGMLTRDTASPREALEWIRRGDPFDLAIVDLRMPDMDGLELAAEIRKQETLSARLRAAAASQRLPIILSSSLGKREVPEALGIATYLSKPIRPSHLYDAFATIFADAPTAQAAAPAKPVLDATMAEKLPLRILVAEDNAVNQKLALRLLAQMGYRADVAGNGIEALQALERQPYDVVLMDVQMPEMDGLEASRQMCARWAREARPRIVAMTANAMQGDREMCLDAGMDDYLSKPIRVNELVDALNRCRRLTNGDVAVKPEGEPVMATNAIDQSVFDQLVATAAGDTAFVAELIDTYLVDSPKLIAQMRDALAVNDCDVFRRAAHSLKSTSANFGAMTLSGQAKELEMMAKQGTLAGAAEKIARLVQEYDRVKIELAKRAKA